ncbi:hypothetical protein ACFYPC_08870 [Streptomyces sp. NPDC005808]|uniref:hypothetical protein n=1 Tax=Streptomyces sp. NPDC005808 TaxID=3364734 RepID=UPI0036C5354F
MAWWEGETAYGPIAAVAEWLRANDIDPSDVPIDGSISIEPGAYSGERRIRYSAVLRNAQGYCYRDPATDQAAREERTASLKAEPPANVQVAGSK